MAIGKVTGRTDLVAVAVLNGYGHTVLNQLLVKFPREKGWNDTSKDR